MNFLNKTYLSFNKFIQSPINCILLLIFCIVLNYWWVLDFPMFFDSEGNLTPEVLKRWSEKFSLIGFFTEIRMMVNYSFALTHHLFDMDTFWYRIINVFIHCGNTVLIFLLSKKLYHHFLTSCDISKDNQAMLALVTAFIFGLNPMALYGVVYIVQRYIELATFFSLLTIFIWLKGLEFLAIEIKKNKSSFSWKSFFWLMLSVFSYYFATHSKAHVVMLPVILLLLAVIYIKPRFSWLKQLILPCFLFLLIAIKVIISRKWLIAEIYEPHAEQAITNLSLLSQQSGQSAISNAIMYPLSILNQCWLFFQYLYLWIIPDVSKMAIDTPRPFEMSFLSFKNILGVLLFLLYFSGSILLLFKEKHKKLCGLGLLFPLILFCTEFSTVRFHENFILYRSYAWMSGFFLVIPSVFNLLKSKKFKILTLIYCCSLLFFLQHRLLPFQNKITLWEDVVEKFDYNDRRIAAAYRSWGNLGTAYANKDQFDKALEIYNKSLKLYPEYQKVWYGLGILYFNHKKYEEAIPFFEKGAYSKPPYKASSYRLGMVYYNLNRLDEAEKLLKLSLQHNPEHLETKENLGNVLFKKGRIDEAGKYYQMSLDAEPGFVKGWNGLGKVMMYKGNSDKAIAYFQNAVNVLPDYVESYYNLGTVYSELGQLDKAITYYLQAIKIDINHKESLYNLANAKLKQGLAAEAVKYYLRVIEINPKSAESHHNLGIAYSQQENHSMAIKEFQTVIKLQPNHAKAYYNLGNSYAAEKKFELAFNSYVMSIKHDPTYTYALHNAGMILVTTGQDEKAIPFFKAAIKIQKNFMPSLEQLKKLNIN
ncbi:hypothetical protein BVY03_03060 [bacterium K02(2017)]|nr:hypothetical protein BVY03_03060 [bacterium K02(2017)]